MDAQAEWYDWLGSSACRPALAAAAQFIMRQAVRLSLPADLLPCADPWKLPPDEKADCLQALADDLWIFLRSRPATWYRKNHRMPLAARGGRLLMLKIAQEFLNELKEQARTYGRDPGRALYRRLRQVLHEAEGVVYRATRQGAFFSLDAGASSWEGSSLIGTHAYGDWDSPLSKVSVQDLEKRSALLTLARLFWEEACRRLGRSCFLPIRELVRFMASHYPGFSTAATISLEANDEASDSEALNLSDSEQSPSGEASFVRLHLEELTRQLAASWAPRQREVFTLIQGQELTLAQAAAQMGYRSAAGVAYLYRTALDVLRDFCLLWPGLSPPDLDEKLFEAFVVQLVEVCKPDSQGHTQGFPTNSISPLS